MINFTNTVKLITKCISFTYANTMNNNNSNKEEGKGNSENQFGGGASSAFVRYKKPEQIQTQTDLVINTRSNRKSAFARIKQLFSLQT